MPFTFYLKDLADVLPFLPFTNHRLSYLFYEKSVVNRRRFISRSTCWRTNSALIFAGPSAWQIKFASSGHCHLFGFDCDSGKRGGAAVMLTAHLI
jgi:hypothetical protein